MALLRAPAEEAVMSVRSFVTLLSVMLILFLAMVPALAQVTPANATGRDLMQIIGVVALIGGLSVPLWGCHAQE
jgi:hypothetical protein